ncbi:MAG: PAS domain S-box protein, partial [Mariprofundales bacterium]|nr:PAS domain S-box protein [Mariprofundales bacterium]
MVEIDLDEVWRRYTQLLHDYCAEPDELLLHSAQRLGREMVSSRVPPEVIADMHAHALDSLCSLRVTDPDCRRMVSASSCMLSEILISYGMAFRELINRQELEESLRLASEVVEHTQDGVIITDLSAHIIQVNPAFCSVTGYTEEEVIGKTPALLHSGRQDEEFYRNMWQDIKRCGSWSGKIWNRRKNGDIYPEHLSITTTYNRDGEATHLVGVFSDISEQEMLEAQLRQAQKMESIGTLVGGIAHDFNNMLAGISGNIYLIRQAVAGHSGMVNRLDQVESTITRASDMIAQLLTFARKGIVQIHSLPLTPFIKEAIKLARVTIPESIIFRYTMPVDDPLVIVGDTTQLQQIVMNLLNNARDAVKGRPSPEITLSLERFVADSKFCERHSEERQVEVGDRFAHLSVVDNGCGIPARVVSRIFDPFFTTKGEGEGTGLGLSMVYGAVQSHHGLIDVES